MKEPIFVVHVSHAIPLALKKARLQLSKYRKKELRNRKLHLPEYKVYGTSKTDILETTNKMRDSHLVGCIIKI